MEWLKGQSDPEALEEHLRNLINSRFGRRLREVIEARLKQASSCRDEDFNNPSWATWTAFRQGQQKAYEDILTLISFNEERPQ